MSYLKTDGARAVVKYPYTRADFAKDSPNVSLFPRDGAPRAEQLAEFDIFEVKAVSQPAPSDPIAKNVVEMTPVLVEGTWTQTWGEEDATAEQIAARQERRRVTTERAEIKADSFVSTFVSMTPDEVADYIEANVTDLASAKVVLKKMGVMLLLLARREYG